MNFLHVSLRVSTIALTMLAGALVFNVGRSFGQDSNVTSVEFPSNAVVAFTGRCPHGWTRYAEGVGRVMIGANDPSQYRTQGGNTSLLADNGIQLNAQNIPTLTGSAASGPPPFVVTGLMPASSSDVGGFLGHTNADVFFYGRTTYATWDTENLVVNGAASSAIQVGSGQPTRVEAVMPYVRLNFCKAG